MDTDFSGIISSRTILSDNTVFSNESLDNDVIIVLSENWNRFNICSLLFTANADITITFPEEIGFCNELKRIASNNILEISANESWELSIFNNKVVGGKYE